MNMGSHDHTPRILIVEDDDMNRELIKSIFDIPCEFHEARTGDEGIVAAQNGIDVVLLDLSLPGMSGLDVLATLKRTPGISHIPVIVITGSPEERHHCLELGAFDFTTKPVDMIDLRLRVQHALQIKFQHEQLRRGNGCDEDTLTRRVENALAERLGRLAEFRDLYESRHSTRVGLISRHLGRLLGLPESDFTVLGRAAPMHDIGKVGIPDAVLLKPEPLREQEFAIMKLHVDIGRSLLGTTDGSPLLEAAAVIISEHHERWDGAGYPAGKSGEDIHLFGRIVGVADVFDSMLSPRVYREAFGIDEAVSAMRDSRGAAFDPRIVDVLLSNLDDFLEIRRDDPSDEDDRGELILRVNRMLELLEGD